MGRVRFIGSISPASTTPKIAGTASVGTSNKYAREDHIHPVQTSVAGNSGSTTKLNTARTINGTSFDGTKNINTQYSYNISLPSNTGGGAHYLPFLKIPKGTSAVDSSITGILCDAGDYASQITGVWIIEAGNRNNVLNCVIDCIHPHKSNTTVKFGYYSDDNFFYIGLQVSGYRSGSKFTVLECRNNASTFSGTVVSTAPTGWTEIPVRQLTDADQLKNAAQGKLYSQTIDLTASTYDVDTYYPITGTNIPQDATYHLFQCIKPLGAPKPSWATHARGYTQQTSVLNVANGWGAQSSFLIVLQNQLNFVNGTVCWYTQMTNSSIPVFWCRGGGSYPLYTDYPCKWTVRTTTYTTSNQSVSPTTTAGTTTGTINKNNLNGNASTATTLQNARNLTIGNTAKSFNGGANVSWSLSEIGAAASSHTHSYLPLSGGTVTGCTKVQNLVFGQDPTYVQPTSGQYTNPNITNTIYSKTTGMHISAQTASHNVFIHAMELLVAVYTAGSASWTYKPIYASNFYTGSSRRFKENLRDITNDEALKLLDINPLHFDFITGEKDQTGFIAEDIELIYPEICNYGKDPIDADDPEAEDKIQGLDYSKFSPYIIKLLQIQQEQINALQDQVSKLSAQIENMK